MILKIKKNPSNKEALELINEGISKRASLILIVCCKVKYEGRAVSRLGLGERTVLIKGDGSFIIHQDRNLEPINWQPPKTKIYVKEENGRLIIRGIRRNPEEILELEIVNLHLISYHLGKDTKELELAGYEEDMREMILKNPYLIEKGFRPTSKEYSTPTGFIDIIGKDKEGKITILELKSRRAGINAVKQLSRYLKHFSDHKKFVRGILVSPSLTEDARELLKENKMEYIELEPPKELERKNKITLDFF
jgi:RecB family endonuclease NucS